MEISFNEWASVNRVVTVSRWCDTWSRWWVMTGWHIITGQEDGVTPWCKYVRYTESQVTVTQWPGSIWMDGVTWSLITPPFLLGNNIVPTSFLKSHNHNASLVWRYHNSLAHITFLWPLLLARNVWPAWVCPLLLSGVKHPVLHSVTRRLEIIILGN